MSVIRESFGPCGLKITVRVPRIFKTYLQELSDICRDYFWVFCHSKNTIWNLYDTNEVKVEKPRAPGGMTGGVEFEAMGYMVTPLCTVLRLEGFLTELATDNAI